MHRSSLASGCLFFGFTVTSGVLKEISGRLLDENVLNLRDGRDECAVSILLAALSGTILFAAEFK